MFLSKGSFMKKFVITYVISLLIGFSVAHATTKCVPDGRGGMCCWDVRLAKAHLDQLTANDISEPTLPAFNQ
jgi:hypothetical protein